MITTTLPLSATRSARPDIDLRRLQRIFDRRAASFDEVAFLPREIAQRMHERFAYIKLAPKYVLDAGCGLGSDLTTLQARFSDATVLGVDLSQRMLLAAAAAQLKEQEPGKPWWRQWLHKFKVARRALEGQAEPLVQADFAVLPFASDSFSLLWSNLALHWHPRPDWVLAEWHRALQAGGLLMFSMLGPDSLRELRIAYQVANGEIEEPLLHTGRNEGLSSQHPETAKRHEAASGESKRLSSYPSVIDFVDMHEIGDMLVEHGFEAPVMDMEMLNITYGSPEALLNDVRRWGAYPFDISKRPNGLVGRQTHAARKRKLIAALEAQRTSDGTIPLTIEVIYGHAWKAAFKALPKEATGYASVRVEEIGRAARSQR